MKSDILQIAALIALFAVPAIVAVAIEIYSR